jgi:YD repeat-containing protein
VVKDAWVLDAGYGEVFNDTAQQDDVVNVANSQYDGQDRLVLATAPEGGTVGYAYSLDLKHNVVQVTQTPKPGSGLSARVTRTAYDPVYNKPTRITDPLGRIATMAYDAATGNLLSVVADAGGLPHFNAKSSFTYTNTGQVLTASDALGTVAVNAYDAKGNVVQVTRDYGRLNQITRMGYDALGNPTEVTDPKGNVTRTAYDPNRRVTSVTAPMSAASTEALSTRYGYDADGRVLETVVGAGTLTITTRATYTPSGKLATSTDAKGNVTRTSYDVLDRVASIADALGRVTSYTYDAMSRRVGVFNPAIQAGALLVQSYTPDGQLASLTDANGNTTSYAYDGFDRLSTTTYPDSSTERQTYDANDNVLTRSTRAKQTFTYTYDTLNRLSTKTPPASGPVVTYTYDLAGRVTSVSDTSSSIVSAVPPTGTTVQYATTAAYDPLNRPLRFEFSPAPSQTTPTGASVTFTHGYNAVDQRISQGISDNSWVQYPSGPSSTSYTANSLNQYTAVGGVTPTYDGNGNLSYDGSFSYCYDAENRLVRVITSGTCASPGTTVATYAYDAQGRRKSKTVGGTTTIYVTDADNREVLEYNGSTGQIQAWYAYGAGLDVLNRVDVSGGTRQTLIPDIQGSIVATLASNTGTLVKRNGN